MPAHPRVALSHYFNLDSSVLLQEICLISFVSHCPELGKKLRIFWVVRIPAVRLSTAGVYIPVLARDGGTPALDLAQRFLSFAEYREVIEGGTRPMHRPKVTFFRLRSGDTIRQIIRMRGEISKILESEFFISLIKNFMLTILGFDRFYSI